MSTAVRTRGGGVAVVTALAGTVFIAAGAFWLSFTALADLARRSGVDAGQAWACTPPPWVAGSRPRPH